MRGNTRVGRIDERIVLVVPRVIPARHSDRVGTVAEAGEIDRRLRGDRRLRAPQAVVQFPFVMGVTPKVGRHHRAPVERAAGRHAEHSAGRSVGADRLAVNQNTRRIQPAAVVFRPVTRLQSGRTGPRRERCSDRLPVGVRDVGDKIQVEARIHDDVVAARTGPRLRQDVVLEDERLVGRVVIGRQHRAVPDDVVGDVSTRAVTRIGQRHAVISEIKRRNVRRQAAAALLAHVNQRVVDENETTCARRSPALVQDGVIDIVEKVVDHRPFGELIGEIDAAGDRTAGVARIVGAVRIAMNVHEQVPFDPRIGAVQVKVVVGRAIEDVVDDLQNGAGPLAAGEVDGVVETPGMAKVVVAEDAVATGGNAVDAVKALRTARGRISGEDAVLNDKRAAVE